VIVMRNPFPPFGVACLASAALLAGCESMPVGTFDRPNFVADAAQAQHDLYFVPGTAALASGEVQGLRSFLQALVLGPQDDVLLHVGRAETPVLNAQRMATLRDAMAATGTRARIRVISPPGFINSDSRPDVVLVQVQRYGRIVVECPSNSLDQELTTPLPPLLGCSNGANRAYMAAEPRDLIAPRRMPPTTDGDMGANAVLRNREGKVNPYPFDLDTTSN
jgi:type IV pilus biogenesis protein CpaD/CtpE